MSFLDKLKSLFHLKSSDKKNADAEACDTAEQLSRLENLKEKYKDLAQNCIEIQVGVEAGKSDLTRFGGKPLVPSDFKWPYFVTDSFDDDTNEIKPRPLAFLAQFDCRSFAEYDADNLLPHEGLLSFFYSIESNRWGFDPKDKGCSRVFWFKDIDSLTPTEFPEDLLEFYRFPSFTFELSGGTSYPDWEEAPLSYRHFDEYWNFLEALRKEGEPIIKLLGHADLIQSEMKTECELVTNNYYCGGSEEIPDEAQAEAERVAGDKWQLLFQMDTIARDDFELMFGDCGRVYFWITKEDLAARRFDRVWLILQCG